MTAREDAIEAGARALDANWGDAVWAILDAVEPIIRADERLHLRAQVEALPDVGDESDPRWSRVYRSSVLRLLGGES